MTPARPRSLPARKISLNTTCDNVKGSIEAPLNLSDLPMTRSGRRVKPQLAWWAGQRLMYIPKCDAVEITPVTPHQLLIFPFPVVWCTSRKTSLCRG